MLIQKKTHPVSVISAKKPHQSSGRKVSWKREDHVSGEREERPPPYNPDNLPVCYSCHVKSSHLYLYSAFNNTNCDKATAQYQNGKIVSIM